MKLDRNRPHGTVVNHKGGAQFYQNGYYFYGNGSLVPGLGKAVNNAPTALPPPFTPPPEKPQLNSEANDNPVLAEILSKSIAEVRTAAEDLKAALVADGVAVDFEPLKGNNADAKLKNAEFIAAHVTAKPDGEPKGDADTDDGAE